MERFRFPQPISCHTDADAASNYFNQCHDNADADVVADVDAENDN